MVKGPVVVVALLTALAGHAHAEPDTVNAIIPEEGCATNSAIAGECFDVQGRAAIRNGIPRFRIDDGARRLYLGVGSARVPPAALKSGALEDALATPEGAIALDWYLDESTATLYALVLEEKR